MAEFIEMNGGSGDVPVPPPKVFTNEFLTSVIKKSISNGDLPADHKLAIIGAIDESGIRAIVSVQVLDKNILGDNHLNIKIQSIVEHDWTGDNRAGAQLLFSVK